MNRSKDRIQNPFLHNRQQKTFVHYVHKVNLKSEKNCDKISIMTFFDKEEVMKLRHTFVSKIVTLIIGILFSMIIIFSAITFFVISHGVTEQMKNDGGVLINTIKREIENYDVSSLSEINKIFQTTREKSEGGIAYISMSNLKGEILVTDEGIYGEDVVSGASEEVTEDTAEDTTAQTDVSNELLAQNASGVVVNIGEEKVYNISETLSNGEAIINVGISMESLNHEIKSALTTILIIGIMIVVIGSLAGLIIVRLLLKNLRRTIKSLDLLALGNLSASFQIRSKDEFGRLDGALLKFTESLRETVGRTMDSIREFETITQSLNLSTLAVTQSNDSVRHQAHAIKGVLEKQLETIGELESTFQGFSNLLTEMTDKATNVDTSNKEISQASTEGNKHLGELVGAMDQVITSFDEGTTRIAYLGEKVDTITEITEVINSVAQQTNLLSLNAAIEAARAGEAGRGFGIVADEIKKLAEQVILSSTNINASIEAVQNIVMQVSQDNKTISQKISYQKSIVENTVQSFESIQSNVDRSVVHLDRLSESIQNMKDNKESIIMHLKSVSSVALEAAESGVSILDSVEEQKAKVTDFETVANNINTISENLREGVAGFTL